MKTLAIIRGIALAGALALAAATPALAAGGGESTLLNAAGGTGAHAAGTGGTSIVRTIVALLVVIALIYGVTWVLRRVKGGRKPRATGSGLEQLATLPLGGGRSVALVRAGREIVLVGIAEQGVTPIRTYTEAEAIAGGIELPAPEPPGIDRPAPTASRLVETLRRMTVRS